jgi:hypothetical protein
MSRTQAGLTGLSDFSAHLIRDVFDALIASAAAQSERQAEIEAMLALSEEVFRQTHISDAIVTERLVALFGPAQIKGNISAVDAGEPYQPAGKTEPEKPAIQRLTGIALGKEAIAREGRRVVITSTGHEKIRSYVALLMAREALRRLATLKNRGIPRVEVERGMINVKLAMKLEEITAAEPTTTTKPSFGLKVAPLSLSSPALFRTKSGVSSELEIHFKTTQKE